MACVQELAGNLARLYAVMESPDFLLPFGHADTERLVTKRKQGIWLFSLMSRILMKIDGFMPWRASGVSWGPLEGAPEASWEGPRDLPERPWELLKGPWADTWGFGGGPGRVPGPSGVSWEALEGPPEASWEGPREVPERPWELLKGPWGSRWRLGRSWGARGAYLEGSWKPLFLFFGS